MDIGPCGMQKGEDISGGILLELTSGKGMCVRCADWMVKQNSETHEQAQWPTTSESSVMHD